MMRKLSWLALAVALAAPAAAWAVDAKAGGSGKADPQSCCCCPDCCDDACLK
jgi:hypothetical protein